MFLMFSQHLRAADDFPTTVPGLRAELDMAISEVRLDFERRLLLVEHTKQFVASSEQPRPELMKKALLVEAVANMRLGNFEDSRQQTDALCPQLDRMTQPEVWFRCNSLVAALTMIRGERQESLEAYERTLDYDLNAVPQVLVARAQIGLAIALNENGRSEEAVDLYEKLILDAVESGDDSLALFAGNNLIVVLITQKDFQAALKTLDGLRPILERNPNGLVSGSLRLHDLELSRVGGDPERAITGLRAFIEEGKDRTPLMQGSAHKLLADALLDSGRADEALEMVKIALTLLEGQAHEMTDTRLSLARIMIGQQRYTDAVKELERIDLTMERVPARRVEIHQRLLEAQLRLEGDDDKIATFTALVSDDQERDALASTSRAKYFDARLTAARRGLALEQAATAAELQAEQSKRERLNSRLWLLAVLMLAFVVCLSVYLYVNRKTARVLLAAKQARNEELEHLVDAKTHELRVNLKAKTELARALESKKRTESIGMLAGNVAHDFNNLLQVISSSNELLSRSDTSCEEREGILALSDQSLSHASEIIRQLLAYSRQQDLAEQSICFRDYLNDTQELFRTALGEMCTLVITDNSHGVGIVADRSQLTTSLLNLLGNASDAMPSGGTVTLSIDQAALDGESAQQWSDLEPGEYLSIRVTDTGTGMTKEELQRATEPFFTTKDSHSGTGLGLSSVQGFVKQSGGDLLISSMVGEGAEVQFLLPITDAKNNANTPSRSSTELALQDRSILLVEDNDQVAGTLQAMIELLGPRVERVESAQAAMGRLTENGDFDLVLTDVRMPGSLDGIDLAFWIKEQFPTLQVLAMSGFSEARANQLDLPVIAKPFSLEQLQGFLAENVA